jgi:hypothetical protein
LIAAREVTARFADGRAEPDLDLAWVLAFGFRLEAAPDLAFGRLTDFFGMRAYLH